jgi:hypothetical protein
VDSQTVTAIISAAGGLAVATAGAIVKGALAQRAGLDEELRDTRTKLYPSVWRSTGATSRWPKSELTWGRIRALHESLRDWYYGEVHHAAADETPGGLYLSRNSQKRYREMQHLIACVSSDADEHDDQLVPLDYYTLVGDACSAFRTALTEDLETRRKRSVWWAIDMRRQHRSEDEKAKMRAKRVERSWSRKELERIDTARELNIATNSEDGTPQRQVVCVDQQVYMRNWPRRDNGWFGQVPDSRRARISVADLEVEVVAEDVGEDQDGLRASLDSAFRKKYEHSAAPSADRSLTDDAAIAILRLIPRLRTHPDHDA